MTGKKNTIMKSQVELGKNDVIYIIINIIIQHLD